MGRSCKGRKRGSISVFIALSLSALLMVTLLFVNSARESAKVSEADAILRLSGRSVLAEYDRRLREEYSLTAFYGPAEDVEERIRYYASAVIDEADMGEIKADMAFSRLSDPDVLSEAILEAMKDEGFDEISRWMYEDERKKKSGGESGRSLKNKAEIENLPSCEAEIAAFSFIQPEKLSEGEMLSALAKSVGEDALLNEYILRKFCYNYGAGYAENHFFQSEAEYIIFGKYSDDNNMLRMKASFIALRSGFNAAYILGDPEKMEIISAASSATGPFAGFTEAAIIALWAGGEALNDWKLISAGEKVPITKSEKTWALSLENATKLSEGDHMIKPAASEGLSYEDYLRIYLSLMNRDRKLYRIMDLIQLNLRACYYPEFRIKDHHTGFAFEAEVRGRSYAYEEKY